MEKVKLSELREKFPMYGDLSDDEFLIGFRKKFYSDIPPSRFYTMIDNDLERARLQKDMVDSMSVGDKLLAGAGKSFVDVGRSIKRLGNMVGIGDYTAEKAKQDEALDKPLMDTTAGKVGKFATDVGLTFVPGLKGQQLITQGVTKGATMLPRAAQAVARGSAPYVGAAGSGAAIGALTSPEDMAAGASIGALSGAGGEAGGRLLSAAYGAGKAVFEPLTQAGRERVLKRTLDRFASDPNAVRAAAANPKQLVPGVTPTLAEATLDPGIAQLQRGAAASSPDVASALAQARGQQVAGYRQVLDDLAGNDGKREFFDAAREATAKELYGKAYGEGLQMTPELQPVINELMQRPSIQTAMAKAKVLAREKGIDISDPAGSVAGLHYAKKALDDMISEAKRAGRGAEVEALMDTQSKLVGFLGEASPSYANALSTYRTMSRPINQMDVGQALRDKALPPLDDLAQGSLARVNANSYANALRNADKTAAQATGLRGAKMADVLDPAQLQAVEGVGQDMARYASAQELARVPGSPTAQYLGVQNIVRQFLGPLGIPQSAGDTLAQKIAGGLAGIPYRMTQNQTERLLGQALADPQTAAKIMAAKDPKTIAQILQPYMAQVAIQLDTQ